MLRAKQTGKAAGRYDWACVRASGEEDATLAIAAELTRENGRQQTPTSFVPMSWFSSNRADETRNAFWSRKGYGSSGTVFMVT